MAKTENYTHYVCDRCGADAYLAANSAAANDWRDVERFDQYGSKATRLLCKSCTDQYNKHPPNHPPHNQHNNTNPNHTRPGI